MTITAATEAVQTRTAATEGVQLRADAETGTVEGIAVPWDTPTRIGGAWGFDESFARGSIDPAQAIGQPLFWQHDEPMGIITDARDDDGGLWISAGISDTATGRDARTLMRDGVVKSFSIRFQPVVTEERETETEVILVRTEALLREVSAVTFPAYETATITEARHRAPDKENPMPPEVLTRAEFDQALAEQRTLTEESIRSLEAALAAASAPEPTYVDNRSPGQALRSLATDEEARTEYADLIKRAYTGLVTGDTVMKPAWVTDLTNIIEDAAVLRNVFSAGALPTTGMSLEFGQLLANTSLVAQQVNQGDDLAYGEVTVTSSTTPVKTYGGYTQLSRQLIERGTVALLDLNLRAQAIATGKALNTAFRADYAALVAARLAVASNAGSVRAAVAGTATYKDWLNAMVDAAGMYQDLGLSMDGLIADSATFKELIGLQGSDGRPVFLVTGNGTNNVGAVNVKALSGEIANLPITLDPKLSAVSGASFFNKSAIRHYDSPVVRLQDENVINLTKDFSLYTYSAIADEIPAAVIPVRRAAA